VKRGLQILSEMSQMTSEVVYPLYLVREKSFFQKKKIIILSKKI
jgi:hypothetical protein